MSIADPGMIATRLGVPEEVVRAVQCRGFLLRLDLDAAQIRERLWRAHVLGPANGRAPRLPTSRRESADERRLQLTLLTRLYEHDYANTIRRSVDGGQSWQPVLSLWRRGAITGLLMEPSRPPALYGAFLFSGPRGATPGVYVTTDGGRTWRNTRLNPSDSAKAPAAETVYAAFGAKGIFKTADSGRTWTRSWPDSGTAPGPRRWNRRCRPGTPHDRLRVRALSREREPRHRDAHPAQHRRRPHLDGGGLMAGETLTGVDPQLAAERRPLTAHHGQDNSSNAEEEQ